MLRSVFKREQFESGNEVETDKKHSTSVLAGEGDRRRLVAEPDVDKKAAQFIRREHHLWIDQQATKT